MARVSPSADDHDDELVHRVAALERTALAWERTGIGLAGVGALLLHLRDESPAMLALGGLLVLAALAVVLGLAPRRYRAARDVVRRGGGGSGGDVVRAGVDGREGAGVREAGPDPVTAPRLLLALSLLVAAVGVTLLAGLPLR